MPNNLEMFFLNAVQARPGGGGGGRGGGLDELTFDLSPFELV